MANKFTAPRGTKDFLPPESVKLLAIESIFRDICSLYCFEPVRTPTFESTELFSRGAGESSDIVSKEMYTFPDKKGRSLTLRPEGTPGVVRALLESGKNLSDLHRLYYIEPMFRYQRPQKGRYREHTQAGVEIFGSSSVTADMEVITLAFHFLLSLGLDKLRVAINSVGSADDRVEYNIILKHFIDKNLDRFCPDCHHRAQHNPMRVFDCKVPSCHEILRFAPKINENLSDESNARFNQLQYLLQTQEIEFVVDTNLVRGLDYYTHTVFEVTMEGDTGQQASLLGGGRYDGLVKLYGGPDTPAIGFGSGLERISEAVDWEDKQELLEPECELAVVCIGEEALNRGILYANMFRLAGLITHIDHRPTSLKNQLAQASKLEAEYALIIGEDELKRGIVIIKNMENGAQEEVSMQDIPEHILELFNDSDISFN